MLLPIKCFLIVLCVKCTRAMNISSNIQNNSDINDLSQCIVNIVADNKFYKPTLAFYGDNMQNNELHTTIMGVIVKNMIPMVSIDYNDYNKTNYINDGDLVYIMYIENCDSLFNITDVKDQNIKYIIIFHDRGIFKCNDSLQKISKDIATYDITFMFKDEEDTYKLTTFIPFIDGITCEIEDIQLGHINDCRKGSLYKRNINVFPNKKPKDMMRCPLNVGMGSLYPFVKSYDQTLANLHPLETVDGSDVQIIKIVANHFNASLNLYHIKTDPENIFLELSFLSFILNGTLDVCAGGLYRIFGDIVSYSGIYSQQAVIWVNTVERENRSWLTFIHKIDGLYIFLTFFFLYSVLWKMFSQYDQQVTPFSNTVFYSWGALFGAASLQDSQTLKKRILNIFYLMLCLHLAAYVSIQLYSFLTIQGPPYVYKDADDISRSRKPLYMKNKAKYFLEDEKYLKYANTSYDCSSFNDCIAKTITNKGITAIVDGLYAPVQKITAKNDEARIIRVIEPILVVYHEMIIRKENLLVGNFEKVMTRLFEAGICQKLYEDSIGILVIDKAKRVNQNIMSNSYSCEVGCKISLSDCAGAFHLWILGCIVSCCVFWVEIVISKKKRNVI